MVTKKKCLGCGKKSSIKLSYTKRKYCKDCFMKLIEKRVRKDIRQDKDIKPGKTIELLNDGSKEFKITKLFLKNIFEKNLEVKEVKETREKTFIPTNMDREVNHELEVYLKNKSYESNGKKLLDNVLEEEIIHICKIKNISYEKTTKDNPLLRGLEQKYPDTKFGLAKSFKNIFS